MPAVPTLAVKARDLQVADRIFLNGQWRPITGVKPGRRPGVVDVRIPGSPPFIRLGKSTVVVQRPAAPEQQETEQQAAPQLAEPTNPQPVPVAEFKRAMTPGSRWLVTNHYITREDHPSFGTTERTVDRATGSHLYLPRPGEDAANASGLPWPKRGQVQRADGGIFLVLGGGAGQKPDDLFMTIRPA